jgi:hypothetical protein
MAPLESRAPADGNSPQERFPYHRRYLRHRVRIRVEVQSDLSFQAWTLNLSEDGLCFEIPARVALEREVSVWIFTGKGKAESPVHARCRVVWSQPSAKGHRHGGQFVRFAEDGLERLRLFLTGL